MDIVVTYDIADTQGAGEKRLRDVAKICEGFGVRSQLSVFECRLSQAAIAELMSALADAIDPSKDSIHLYRISGGFGDNRFTLGRFKHQDYDDLWLL